MVCFDEFITEFFVTMKWIEYGNASIAGWLYGKIVTELPSHYWSFNTYEFYE